MAASKAGRTRRRAVPQTGGPVFSGRDWAVRVRSACRLSFTLIDMNGSAGRRHGMASMSLEDPSLEAVLRPAARPAVVTDPVAAEYRPVIRDFLRRLQQAWGGPPVRVVVERGIPTHHGLGSKTTTLLALGKAYAEICGRRAGTDEIAVLAGRAGTSGGSVNLADRGGFLVDGGHAVSDEVAGDPHRFLQPSRFAGPGRRPPVLIHSPFPAWPVLLIEPAGNHIHGEPERRFFRETLPMPIEEAHRTAHAVLMRLAPAVLEADYSSFCRAFEFITRETWFKQRQIGLQNEAVHRVLGEAHAHGVDAIGMSSMGPACFAFTRRPRAATRWLDGLREAGLVRRYAFSRVTNEPVRIHKIPV